AASSISRSAPCPARSRSSACSRVATWRTAAPLAAASRAATEISGRSPPTRSTLMPALQAACSVALHDLGHGDAEMVVHDQHLATRDQAVVDVDLDRLTDLAVELDHRPAPKPEELAHRHRRLAENGGELDRDVVDGAELLDRGLADRRRRRLTHGRQLLHVLTDHRGVHAARR